MPDITVCTNEDCPMRDKCYRATVEWDDYQSACNFQWEVVGGTLDCKYYWPLEEL